MAAAVSVYPPLEQRPVKNTILLFDVDDTLTMPRQVCDLSSYPYIFHNL
jgi:phosphomannomutase